MVAVKSQSASRFASAPPRNVRGVLLYGSDEAQIASSAASLAAVWSSEASPADPLDIIKMQDADIAAAPERIAVELMTVPMFAGTRLVWLVSPPASAHTAIAAALDSGLEGARLLIQAPELRKNSKLVQMFEASPALAAVACYGVDERDMLTSMRQQIKAAGNDIEADALALLQARAGGSQIAAQSEIEKLVTYAGPKARITLSDVEAVTGDQAEAGFDDVIESALDGRAGEAIRGLDRLLASGVSSAAVLSLFHTKLMRLHGLRVAVEAGEAPLQAVKKLRPPVFFKQEAALARQSGAISLAALAEMIGVVAGAALESRLKSGLADQVTAHAVLRVAVLCAQAYGNDRSSAGRG